MRIINLLEGSDRLFHITKLSVLRDILHGGSLLGVPMSEKESERVRDRLGITGKLFYISFARSMYSSFIQKKISGNVVCFEVDGTKLGRYGKVKPFNYFSDGGADEMEDRLVGDRVRIPLNSGVITGARIICNPSSLENYNLVLGLVECGIPVKLFSRMGDMLVGRRFETDLNVYFAGAEDDTDDEDTGEIGGVKNFIDIISRYIDGDVIGPDEVRIVKKVYGLIEYRVNEMFHRFMNNHYDGIRGLMIKMRKYGVTATSREDFLRAIHNGIMEGDRFKDIWRPE